MKYLLYPIATEKALNMIERDNIILYIVDRRADKKSIKKEFEEVFSVKVRSINTALTMRNLKKAYIRIDPKFRASDVARKLKLV